MNAVQNEYPKISIVTPSYNQARTLEKTILSVLNQNYPNLEYIIMDGGSTDDSVKIIQNYASRLTYWQSKPDGGQSAAINTGFTYATGDIFAWLNSDDWYEKNTLHKVARFFIEHNDAQWTVGYGEMRKPNGKVIRRTQPDSDITANWLAEWGKNGRKILQPTCFWKRELWHQAGGLKKEYHFALDLDLWLRFSRYATARLIPELLACAEYESNIKSLRCQHLSLIETTLALSENGYRDEAIYFLTPFVKFATKVRSVVEFCLPASIVEWLRRRIRGD